MRYRPLNLMLHRASDSQIACLTITLHAQDPSIFRAQSQALFVVLYQIDFALDLSAFEGVMVMFASLRLAYRGEPHGYWPAKPDEPGG